MKKIKKFVLENWWFLLSIVIVIFLFNYHLPYYINMPGGTININDRIECDSCSDINGSLNMLYVSEYEATIATYLMSYIMPNWDLEEISTQQISDETQEEIYDRNRLMLDNSIDNAIYVAYKESGKDIEISDKRNVVIATTISNGLKIGDEILEIDGNKIEDINEIKGIIDDSEVGDKLKFKIIRDDKEEEVEVEVREEDSVKMIGAVIVMDLDYKLDPDIDLKFKASESGSSGGMMLALSIYSKISGEDLVRGRNIAGTGTIDMAGNVGEIDGIKYKIMGAYKDNIDIVLVPSANYKDAVKVKKKYDYDMEIVKVDTFSDVIDYLKK